MIKLDKWQSVFNERELRLVANARLYAQNDPAGLPGHNLMVIIDKMADLLDGVYAVVLIAHSHEANNNG